MASPYNSNAPYGSTSHGGNDYYGSGQPDKLSQTQAQVDEVVSIMHQNLGKVMERGERLDDLQERTDQLQNQANQFRTGATKIRKQFWWKNVKLNLIIAGIVILLLIIIIVPLVIKFAPSKSSKPAPPPPANPNPPAGLTTAPVTVAAPRAAATSGGAMSSGKRRGQAAPSIKVSPLAASVETFTQGVRDTLSYAASSIKFAN